MKCDAKEKREEDERSTNARNDEKENSKSWQYLTCTGETMDEDDENECPWESGEDDENEKYEKNVDVDEDAKNIFDAYKDDSNSTENMNSREIASKFLKRF